MADYSLEDLEAERARRRGEATFPSVMAEKGTAGEEALKFIESSAKGGATGVLGLVGGWGNWSDWRKQQQQGQNVEPSPFSTAGMATGIKNVTGVDLLNVPGYRGAYEIGQTAVPTAALYAIAPELSLFGRGQTALGTVGRGAAEVGTNVATGLAAQSIAPDSPLAQLAIQASPYVLGGATRAIQNKMVSPTGQFEPSSAALLDVGRMTPGEYTGSRMQLSKEAAAEVSPKIEAKGTSFRQAQAKDAETFVSNLFDRASSQAITDPTAVAEKLTGAFKNYGNALNTTLKTQASKDFGIAAKAGGVVDVTPVLNKSLAYIDSLPPEAPGTASMRNYVRALKEKYTNNPNISIKELQTQMALWGDAAYSGKNAALADVAPGMVRGVARQILGGFRESMDAAIDSGVAGAKDLKIARDNFSNNLQRIEEFRKSPLKKAFGKDLTEIVPEDLVAKLNAQKPTQRALLFNMLQDEAPEIADTIRRVKFNEILTKSQAKSPAANQPTFVIDEALAQMNAKNGELAFLFPNKKDAVDASKAMQWMRQVIQSESAATGGKAVGEIYSGVRGAGGTAQTALAAKTFADTVKGWFASPNAVADVVFNPETVQKILDYKAKPTVEKIYDLAKTVTVRPTEQGMIRGPLSTPAVAVGGRIGIGLDTTQPQENKDQTNGFSIEDLMREKARRSQRQSFSQPQSTNDLQRLVSATIQQKKVPVELAKVIPAIVQTESSWNPTAANKTSSAKGLFQMTNAARADVGIPRNATVQQDIEGGIDYLMKMYKKYGTVEKAVQAYNQGHYNPRSKEGKQYVSSVLRNI